jgi:hypothetical protein
VREGLRGRAVWLDAELIGNQTRIYMMPNRLNGMSYVGAIKISGAGQ